MGFVPCALPHPLAIVLTVRCLETTAKDYPGLSFPQNAAEVEADLSAFSRRGVIALVDDRQPDNLRVSFCTPRYELVCGLTQQKDAWFAIRLAPLGLRAHNQIARGALRVNPQGWQLFTDLGELNRQGFAGELPTGSEAMLSAWKQLRQAPRTVVEKASDSGLTPAQLAFLANVDTLIDLACEVELEQAARLERVMVKGVEVLSGSICRFALSVPGTGFRVGEYLRSGYGETGAGVDGVVTESAVSTVTIRFFQQIETEFMKKVRWLAPKVSTKQFAIQHAAVRALQNGESLNPALLGLIVEGRFGHYAAPALDGDGRANPAQRALIERSLAVPDLLLALGPPGTGKTDTIRAIVARETALGKRVLVTSKNNKAVDHVLEGLKSAQALRIGREEVVSPEVRPMLIDSRASALQQGIMAGSQSAWQALDRAQESWTLIQQSLERLYRLADDVRLGEFALREKRLALTRWQSGSFHRIERSLARQENHTRLLLVRLGKAVRRADSLRRQLAGLQTLSRLPLVGGLFILLAARMAEDWQQAARQYRVILLGVRKSRESQKRIWEAYRHYVTASEQALQFKRGVQDAELAAENSRMELGRGLDALRRLSSLIQSALPGDDGLPGLPSVDENQPVRTQLDGLSAAWRGWLELQTRRRELLGEWREAIQNRPQALYPTLIRSAEVVGATCIGIATDARFEDLEFDLVLADEAGQIQVMDLLVPLVRARRAVLVGDHLQLPPLVEPEITEKIREREPENQELGEWLEKSLFERLIMAPATPASNKVMLDTQYRMPRPIADFISAQFYGGSYRTGREIPHSDPFFGGPLVFIDTMKEVRHYEQRAEDGQGYSNPTEARLISDLLLAYQKKGIEAGVIVPYKRQAELIRREVRRRAPELSEDALASRVATVDSFQGREQDVIIFGFTRSNADGRIGFLTELRRLNVSLTRARRQLLLVGDSLTLTSTPDAPFARLAQSLLERVRKLPKAYLQSGEMTNLLN